MSKIVDARATRAHRRRAQLAAVLGALAPLFLSSGAGAQALPLTLRLSHAVTWDENVFRLPEHVTDPVPGVAGRSDRYSATAVGLRFEKQYSRQSFLLDASQAAVRYEKFTTLDQDTLAYRAAWQWALGDVLSGALSADRSEGMVDFADVGAVRRIARITETRSFSADAWISGGWHLLAGASRQDIRNSELFFAQPSTREDSGEVGLRYLAASQSSVRLLRRERRGENTDVSGALVGLIDSEYEVSETQFDAAWVASAASTVNASLLNVERRHPNVPQRDFSGSGASLAWAWVPSGRLNITASVAREIVPFSLDVASSHRVDESAALGATWQVGGRSNVQASASQRDTDFPGSDALGAPLRRDRLRTLEVGFAWLPHRIATIEARLRRERRTSTLAEVAFEDTIASLSLSLVF